MAKRLSVSIKNSFVNKKKTHIHNTHVENGESISGNMPFIPIKYFLHKISIVVMLMWAAGI